MIIVSGDGGRVKQPSNEENLTTESQRQHREHNRANKRNALFFSLLVFSVLSLCSL
jgi:hypothetical protein